MRIRDKSKDDVDVGVQLAEDVHKPFLAASMIVRQGHHVVLGEQDAHTHLSGGGKIPMRHVSGTHVLNIWLKDLGFALLSVL